MFAVVYYQSCGWYMGRVDESRDFNNAREAVRFARTVRKNNPALRVVVVRA